MPRISRWRALAVGLLAVHATTAPAPAAPVPDSPRVELAGTTTVDGAETAMIPVHLPAPVEVSTTSSFSGTEQTANPNPDIQISGAGRLSGIVLTQNGSERVRDDNDNDGATLYAVRYGMCPGTACQAVRSGVTAVAAFGPGVETLGTVGVDQRYVLPAGDYNLYVITDGTPVSVTLTMHGLSGTTTVTPVAPVDIHLSEATVQDDGLRYEATDEHLFAGLGMIVVATLTRSTEASLPMGGYCIVRHPTPAAPTDPADGPTGCISRVPASTVRQHSGDFSDNFHGAPPGTAFIASGDYPSGRVHIYSSFDPGRYRVSQSYVTTPLDNSRTFLAMWLGWSAR